MILNIEIQEDTIAQAVALSRAIPELVDPYDEEEYRQRLEGNAHLILTARVEGNLAGFKVGYERDGYFYSWMGGVLPAYRRLGLAQHLAEQQEAWVREQGYPCIRFKTRNCHKTMLCFALRNGFYITGVDPLPDPAQSRIWLQKDF